MIEEHKQQMAAVAGGVAALLIAGGLSMLAGQFLACILIVLGIAAAWLALTLKDWCEFTSNRRIQLAFWIAICIVLGGLLLWAHLGETEDHQPIVVDPEAAENKYVRKWWVSPPDDKKFARAFLVEFGVNRLNSVGVAVGVQFNGDSFDFWY